jgi:protein SCO1
MTRVLLVLVLAVVAAAASAIALAAGHSTPSSTGRSTRVTARLAGTDVWPAGTQHAATFALRDQNGRLITRSSLRGHVWAITFLDSSCRQACPVAAKDLAHAQHLLSAHEPLTDIVVSVLPQYDTPARVRAFAHKTGLTGNWHWLLGTKRELAPVWKAYGISVVTGVEHTSALYLVDKRGDIRVADAIPFIPSQLAGSVRALERTARARGSSGA